MSIDWRPGRTSLGSPFGGGGVVVPAAAGLGAFVLLGLLAEQAGVPGLYVAVLVAPAMLAVLVTIALASGTHRFGAWLLADRNRSAASVGLAGAIGLTGMAGFVLPAGTMIDDPVRGAVLAGGPVAGLALAGLLLAAHYRQSGAASPGTFLAARFPGWRGRMLSFAAFGTAAFLMLWGELALGAWALATSLGLTWAAACSVMALLILLALPGGLVATLRTGAVLYVLVAAGLLVPLAWLTAVGGSLPVPQLGWARAVPAGLPASPARPLADLALMGVLLLAACGHPALIAVVQSARSASQARQGLGWAALLAAAVLSAAPAIAAFAHHGVAASVRDLATGEIALGAQWLLDWSATPALSGSGSRAASLCGRIAATAEEAVAACGGNAGRPLAPTDIALAPETATLALADITGLPAVFGGLLAAVALGAALASAKLLAFSFGASFEEDVVHGVFRPHAAALSRLVLGRTGMLAGILLAAALAIVSGASPLQPGQWGLALCAGTLAPVLLGATWWQRMRRSGAHLGLVAGGLTTAMLWFLGTLGPDFALSTGDEFGLALAASSGLPQPMQAVLFALPATLTGIVGGSLLGRGRRGREPLAELRAPDQPVDRGVLVA